MTRKEIADMIRGIGYPFAYQAFRTQDKAKKVPDPPFIIFYYGGSGDLYADNSNYQKIEKLSIELYTDKKEFDIEDKVEAALKEHGLTYRREETYLEDERMLMNVYETEVLI